MVYPNLRNFSQKFSYYSTLLPENLEFSVNSLHYGNSTIFFLSLKGHIYSGVCVVDNSKETGSGVEDSSLSPHSDLSAMSIMFITPSGLPVA